MPAFDSGHEERLKDGVTVVCRVPLASVLVQVSACRTTLFAVWLLLCYSVGAEEDSLMGLHLDCLAVKS